MLARMTSQSPIRNCADATDSVCNRTTASDCVFQWVLWSGQSENLGFRFTLHSWNERIGFPIMRGSCGMGRSFCVIGSCCNTCRGIYDKALCEARPCLHVVVIVMIIVVVRVNLISLWRHQRLPRLGHIVLIPELIAIAGDTWEPTLSTCLVQRREHEDAPRARKHVHLFSRGVSRIFSRGSPAMCMCLAKKKNDDDVHCVIARCREHARARTRASLISSSGGKNAIKAIKTRGKIYRYATRFTRCVSEVTSACRRDIEAIINSRTAR